MGFTNPILGVTGNTLPEQIQDFEMHGCDEVVPKPVRPAMLKEAITRRLSSIMSGKRMSDVINTELQSVLGDGGGEGGDARVDLVIHPLSGQTNDI